MAEKKDEEKLKIIPKSYHERLRYLKKAQEYSAADDIPKAVENYSQYLNSLALFYQVEESRLNPQLFDQERDVSELFLISHAYWDLAKAYDRSPNLHRESLRCLDQFVKFTIGYKYQYVNARTIKAFIKKGLAYNPKAFKQAYEKIQVESKGCFIATDLYSHSPDLLDNLRGFKKNIATNRLGMKFIEVYYNFLCPLYFNHMKKSFLVKKLLKAIIYLVHSLIKVTRQ